MFHVIYLLAFVILAFLAIGNLIRSLVQFSIEAQRPPAAPANRLTIHPELLDDQGRVTEEPLLVIKSFGVEDDRRRLDAIYNDRSTNLLDSEEA
jgi:hypothetical protein